MTYLGLVKSCDISCVGEMEGVVTIVAVLVKRMTKVMSHMTYIGEIVVECECTRNERCYE